MSIYIALLLMLFLGILGGIINYFLPANENPDKTKIRKEWQCLLLGIGATFLMPLFLEIAQSKLMDNMFFGWSLSNPNLQVIKKDPVVNDTTIIKITITDSTKKTDTTITNPRPKPTGGNAVAESGKDDDNLAKKYLLFAAYCFLAAAAGIRFISTIMDSVLKEKQIEKLEGEKEKEKTAKEKAQETAAKEKAEKEKIEKLKKKSDMHNMLNWKESEKAMMKQVEAVPGLSRGLQDKPKIGDITVPGDPQKNRFGGKSENKGRRLSASVVESSIPDFYDLTIWVESTDESRPINSKVIFYLHDTFAEPIQVVEPGDFDNGMAIIKLKAWGAFTVGAFTDDGNTLLELDLAQLPNVPKEFAER